jgi:hypothetical protein
MKTQTQELVFRLTMVPASPQTAASVWLEAAEQQLAIRFDDVQSLARYLNSMVQGEFSGGLK